MCKVATVYCLISSRDTGIFPRYVNIEANEVSIGAENLVQVDLLETCFLSHISEYGVWTIIHIYKTAY